MRLRRIGELFVGCGTCVSTIGVDERRMNARRFAALGLGTLGLLLQMGCAFTQQVHLSLQDMSRPSREMRQELLSASANALPVQGHSIGGRQLRGREYSTYQFTNVLTGPPDRVLEVLVAEDTYQVCRIGESVERAAGGSRVLPPAKDLLPPGAGVVHGARLPDPPARRRAIRDGIHGLSPFP